LAKGQKPRRIILQLARFSSLTSTPSRVMVAPARLRRRWFIKNGTFPGGHPAAELPVDGYYGSEADAIRAQEIMVECYGISAEKLPIVFEDVGELALHESDAG
jgi:hypothetical protein